MKNNSRIQGQGWLGKQPSSFSARSTPATMTNQCNSRLLKNKRWLVCSDQFHQRQDLPHNLVHLALLVRRVHLEHLDHLERLDHLEDKGHLERLDHLEEWDHKEQAVLRGSQGMMAEMALDGCEEAIEDRAHHLLAEREAMAEMARQQE